MLGMRRIRLQLRRKPVGLAAGREPAERPPFEPSMRLGADHLKETVTDQRHRAERHARAPVI